MPLTDTSIRKAKVPETAQKLTDSQGLHLLLTPAGGKLWRFAYRFDGKRNEIAFGASSISLVKARSLRDEARTHLAEGRDPAAVR